jgi:polar amino acid transport system substrate-binding protein
MKADTFVMKALVIIVWLVLVSIEGYAGEQERPLTVMYFHRPPYYATVNGQAQGFLVELAERIIRHAGFSPQFIEIPPQRILYYLKESEKKWCSIGWFKTKEREEFAKFSKPIYQNRSLVVLTTKAKKERIEKHPGLKDLFFDQSLVLTKIDSFSYGTVIDQWINNYAPRIHDISSNQRILPKLIIADRADYMLTAPEEIHTLLVQAGVNPEDFVSISKPDIPKGNKRYIIYHRGVSDAVIDKINSSITALVPQIF